ncbi:MAG: lantibiotic modifying enzyme, partial [Candidatus Azotimanducaceae bacterium]
MSNYLQEAIKTETFLASNLTETDTGSTWRRTPEGKVNHSLYHGSAGVLIYYIELYLATDDEKYLKTAVSAGNELLSYVLAKAKDEDFITIGIYSGWPGYVYALNELYKVSLNAEYQTGAIKALERMTAQSSEIGAGIGWIEAIPFSDITGITGIREVIDLSVGAAGAGIMYLYAYREGL